MPPALHHRRLWRTAQLALQEARLIFASVRDAKQRGARSLSPLRGRHVALLCGASCAAGDEFSRAVNEAGGRVALLDTDAWRSGHGFDLVDAAKILGSLYDAVDCCGLPAEAVERIEQHARIPVFDGIAQAEHPLRSFSAVLTMIEWEAETHGPVLRPLSVRVAGDATTPSYQAGCVAAQSAGLTVQALPPDAPGQADFVLDPAAHDGLARVRPRDATAIDRARIAALLSENDRALLQGVIARALN